MPGILEFLERRRQRFDEFGNPISNEENQDIFNRNQDILNSSQVVDHLQQNPTLTKFVLKKKGVEENRDPKGFISGALDLISRPLFGASKATDVLINEGGGIFGRAYKAVKEGLGEVFSPNERLTFADVIQRTAPEFSAINKEHTAILGLAGDLALDPLNLFSFGTGSVLKAGRSATLKSGKLVTLSKRGEKVFGNIVNDLSQDFSSRNLSERSIETFSTLFKESPDKLFKAERAEANLSRQKEFLQLKSNLSKNLSDGTFKPFDAVRIVDEKYIDALLKQGQIPKTTKKAVDIDVAPTIKTEVQEQGRKTVQELKFYKIDKDNNITVQPKVRGVNATDAVELNPGETIFSVNQDNRVRALQGKFSKSQRQEINKLTSTLEEQRQRLIEVRARTLSATRIGDSRSIGSIVGESKAASTPSKLKNNIAIIFPESAVTTPGISSGKVKVARNTDVRELKFAVPERENLVSFDELSNVLRERKELRKLQQQRTKQDFLLAESKIQEEGLSKVDARKLLDQGGFKILGRTVFNMEDAKKFFNVTGIDRLLDLGSKIPGVKFLEQSAKQLQREYGLSYILEKHFPEWVRFRRHLEAKRSAATEVAEKSFIDIFGVKENGKVLKVLNKEQREKIGTTLSEAQGLAKKFADELGLDSPTHKLANQALKETLDKAKLLPEERAALVKLRASFNEILDTERQAGLLQRIILNYVPQRYEATRNVRNFVKYRTWLSDRSVKSAFTADEVRKFKDFESLEEIAKAGYSPILDAGQLYLLRFFEHVREMRNLELEMFRKTAYGTKKIPLEIDKDLVRLGERFPTGQEPFLALRVIDAINGAFRRSATIVRPAFAGKQAIGNFSQLLAETGAEAFKIFDPTVVADSFSIIARGEIKTGFTDVWGIKWTPEDLTKAFNDFPVRKNIAIETIGAHNETSLTRSLVSDIRNHHVKSSELPVGSRQFKGFVDLLRKGSAYLHLPSFVEDWYRSAAFLNGIKSGYSPSAAMEMVDRALFNYTTSLGQQEQFIRRHIIPFWTFQKYATILLGKTILQKPARVSNLVKLGKGFLDVWGKIATDEELTEAEREVLPGYLLEQPRAFEGFSPEMNAKYRVFNHLTFLDVVDFIQSGENGEFDPRETFIKGIAAQLAPVLKVPLETLIFKRSFFTDKPMEGAFSAGKLGDVDSDKFFENLFTISGLHTGLVGGGLGFASGKAVTSNEDARNLLKKMVGWEEGVDSRTGKKTVWINPYMFTIATSILPSLTEAIRLSRNDRSIKDKVMQTVFGINLLEFNLVDSANFKANDFNKKRQEAVSEYRNYIRQGRYEKADAIMDEFEQFIQQNERELELINDPRIRGQNTNIIPVQ